MAAELLIRRVPQDGLAKIRQPARRSPGKTLCLAACSLGARDRHLMSTLS